MEQRLWQTLSQTNEWVKYSDGKAVALLGIQGVLIGLVVALAKDFSTDVSLAPAIFFITGTTCIVAAMFFTFLCLIPHLRGSGKTSPIFFKSVAINFKNPEEYSRYLRENFNSDENASEALAEQIYANSKIATIKFKWVALSTSLTLLGLVAWAIYLIIEFL